MAMNPGKRYLRNTVFVLWGVAAAFVGWNRLYARVAGEDAQEKHTLLSLGLRVQETSGPRPDLDLAAAKDFTKVSVHGDFTLEIVGAPQYKVTFTPAEGTAAKLHASLDEDGYLHARTDDGVTGGTLRIEVPQLERIDANVPRVLVQGMQGKELSLVSYRGGAATLRENHVESWRLFSGQPFEVRVDDITFSAGGIKSNGDVVIRRDN
jgi:hypothetical protein